jgi:methyl-accepting chemotaxis protein
MPNFIVDETDGLIEYSYNLKKYADNLQELLLTIANHINAFAENQRDQNFNAFNEEFSQRRDEIDKIIDAMHRYSDAYRELHHITEDMIQNFRNRMNQ